MEAGFLTPTWYLVLDSFVGRREYPVSFQVVSSLHIARQPSNPFLSTVHLAVMTKEGLFFFLN